MKKIMEQSGDLEQDAVCTVRDVLEKVVTDYAHPPSKAQYGRSQAGVDICWKITPILQRIEGKFNQSSCQICSIADSVGCGLQLIKLNHVVSCADGRRSDAG